MHSTKYNGNTLTLIFCKNNHSRKFIDIAYLEYTRCCYTAVNFRWWKKRSSNDLKHDRMNITKLSVVTCGMFFHCSWRAIRSWPLFTGSGSRRRTAWSRTSTTYSIGDKSGEYAGQSGTHMLSSTRNSLQTLAMWGLALSCWKMVLFWRMNGRAMGRSIPSRYLTSFRLLTMACCCAQCPWDISAHTNMPPLPCATLHTTVTSALSSPCGPTYAVVHLFCETGNVTRHWRGHSSIVPTSSSCDSWPRRVAVVVEQGWGLI